MRQFSQACRNTATRQDQLCRVISFHQCMSTIEAGQSANTTLIASKMLLVPSATMTAPSVHITYPPASLLEFPPASLPTALFPPKSDHTLARPFDIDPELYNNLLSVNYPLTIALIYATTVTILNRFNKQRENKPWAMSRSRAFYAFVIVHNVFLAIYSFWTFAGMIHAIRHAWPGWQGEYGLTGVVDSLCKIHGPRGLGSAATYNSTTSTWGITNEAIKLVGGNPDSTDLGRIWNEGLAFYGWLFYVSKFYEVVDTLIVLAKGKNSSFLQTYHHAGAMLCMWAGIRYMSPPIWMFVLINSGIHGLMVRYVSPAVRRQVRTDNDQVHILRPLCAGNPSSPSSEKNYHLSPNSTIRLWRHLRGCSSFYCLFCPSQHAIPLHTQHFSGLTCSHFLRLVCLHVCNSLGGRRKLVEKDCPQSSCTRGLGRKREKQARRDVWT